jgi:hypothetical protein
LRARAWLASDLEPTEWQATATDTDLSLPSALGVRSILSASNTDVNPVISYDDLALLTPQTFTVTRSVNGVVKAHTAGESVSLANPTILPL